MVTRTQVNVTLYYLNTRGGGRRVD